MLTQFIVGGTTVNAYDRIREFEMAEDDKKVDDRDRDYRDGGGVDKNSKEFLEDQNSEDDKKKILEDQKRVTCRAQDYIIVSIFWSALLLNSSGAYYGQQPSPADPNKTNSMGNDPTQAVFEFIASALYLVNVVFLVFQRIPCISDSVFPQDWRCCQCDCRAREYAITSAVFFAFSIGSLINSFVYLG
tara:strand:+ start:3805 stop:4368 length:564 start_codon:yes stop_codon:yes gene_type:complete